MFLLFYYMYVCMFMFVYLFVSWYALSPYLMTIVSPLHQGLYFFGDKYLATQQIQDLVSRSQALDHPLSIFCIPLRFVRKDARLHKKLH